MIFSPRTVALHAACLTLVAGLSACSSVENLVAGDKIDYRGGGKQTAGLEVPPDLTQLSRDSRYQQQQGGTVSASTFQNPQGGLSPVAAATVAPQAIADLRIERQGNERWLVSTLPPEKLWPLLQSFWGERGFALTLDQPEIGVMETEWAENRAKLPQDLLRNTLGRLIDSLYSTGERDKFRTRVERTSAGSEVFISHRGMIEVYANTAKDSTVWQPRPADPELESEFLQRLMVKLGATQEVAKATVANAPSGAARARLLSNQPGATLQVDDNFDRAWRRVGLALDRSGFTVEDRDRSQGLYYVRYVDPALSKAEEPGIFSRMFSWGEKKPDTLSRYRVSVKGEANQSTVRVLNAQGTPEAGPVGQRIVGLLVDDLK